MSLGSGQRVSTPSNMLHIPCPTGDLRVATASAPQRHTDRPCMEPTSHLVLLDGFDKAGTMMLLHNSLVMAGKS
jgi:hypothetical protein